MERALIVKSEWLEKIFAGQKVWEMRSAPTKVRGKIGLIESGSGMIVGEAVLQDCLQPLSDAAARIHLDKHQVKDIELLRKWKYPWLLTNVRKYPKPIPYDHPKGAVIWVKL